MIKIQFDNFPLDNEVQLVKSKNGEIAVVSTIPGYYLDMIFYQNHK
jgi:hypothetical protein